MVQIDCVTGERVTVTCGVDTPTAKLLCLVVCQIPVVALVQNTIRESASGSDREKVALEARTVRVDVEDSWTLVDKMRTTE